MQILIVLMVCVSLSLKPCQAKVKESVSVECVVCVWCVSCAGGGGKEQWRD